jgi:hypothetical protein
LVYLSTGFTAWLFTLNGFHPFCHIVTSPRPKHNREAIECE